MRKTRRRRILRRYRCSAARGEHRTCMGDALCIRRDRSARCRLWSVRAAAKCSGPSAEIAGTNQRGSSRHGRVSSPRNGCNVSMQAGLQDSPVDASSPAPAAMTYMAASLISHAYATPRGCPGRPDVYRTEAPVLCAGFNLSYATSGAATAGHPEAWLSAGASRRIQVIVLGRHGRLPARRHVRSKP